MPIPPFHLRRNSEDDERFRAVAVSLAETLERFGLHPDDALLDVGCGVGRLPIGLLERGSHRGRYVGFDVSVPHVRWARKNLKPLRPDWGFRRIDVQNDRYNPEGGLEGRTARFPVRDAGFDFACLFSVFTHFYADDIAQYLHELHRSLRPGGRVVATWFLWDESRRADVETSAHPMVRQLDEHVLYADDTDPLWAIAHHVDKVTAMVAEAGLEVELVQYGTWAHGPGPEFQDVIVLRKPTPVRGRRFGLRRRD